MVISKNYFLGFMCKIIQKCFFYVKGLSINKYLIIEYIVQIKCVLKYVYFFSFLFEIKYGIEIFEVLIINGFFYNYVFYVYILIMFVLIYVVLIMLIQVVELYILDIFYINY